MAQRKRSCYKFRKHLAGANRIIVQQETSRKWEWWEEGDQRGLPLNGVGECRTLRDAMAEAGVTMNDNYSWERDY